MGIVRLIIVLGLAVLLIFALLPFQLLGRLCLPKLAKFVPIVFHKSIAFLFGVRIRLNGEISRSRPLMIIANHVSWLDIVVLSSIAPVSFVAKSEMASWPLFGQLAWLQRTIFVRREERRRSGEQASEIADRLSANDTIVLFPEGTTSDGHELWPFKTPLFEAARFAVVASDHDHALIQPVALDYSHLHGLPIARQWRQHIAWPGDVGLAESLLPLIRKGALDVTIHCGEPIMFTADSKRKIVAQQSRQSIRALLGKASLDSPL